MPGKTEVTQGSGPRLGKSRGTLRELSSGGLEGPTRRATKGKKGHSGVTSAPEGNLCPPKTPTGGTSLPSGQQGKQGRESQIKILPYPKARERAASLTPKRRGRGEHRKTVWQLGSVISEPTRLSRNWRKNQRPAWAT